MNLEELRAKIDGIDDTLVQAFLQLEPRSLQG